MNTTRNPARYKPVSFAMIYDVVIVGGGPAGLSAALTLGRARKRVLLCDTGPARNAAAIHIHNFVTREGVTPAEFRRIGREQLMPYPSVQVREVAVTEIRGERGAFEVRSADASVESRRILLCTGMVDMLPQVEGFDSLWGKSIFQCPYCHGWEVQDQRFALLAESVEMLDFALVLRGWSGNVVAMTDGRYAVPAEVSARLGRAGVRLEERKIVRLVARGDRLAHVEFIEGEHLRCDLLFSHPHQKQVAVVEALGLGLDAAGFVRVDEMQRETSRAGIYAGGDLTTRAQGAIVAAAQGMMAAAMLNNSLTAESAIAGELPASHSSR